jgi:MFS family permease
MQRDITLLFATRIVRMFAYGFLSVVLALYLAASGLSEAQIGILFSLTLAGDAALSLWLTTRADRIGRRRVLVIGAWLMVLAGVVFALTNSVIALTVAAIVGVISPSGNEIGPFLPIEQAALTQLIPGERRTQTFAWYNLAGSFATAAGALICGAATQLMRNAGLPVLAEYRAIVVSYALFGIALALLFTRASERIEVAKTDTPTQRGNRFGLHQSRGIVAKLSAFFALDAFGGALVLQSFMAYWFARKFDVQPAVLGSIFFGANILAGISALLASRIAARIGLINTMVYTHIPSNILLLLVPLMPTLPAAIAVLLARFSISQMDVPTRQSYVMAVVSPDERSAAAGITGIARSVGSAFAPTLTGLMLRAGGIWLTAPFVFAGGLKILYDVLLWRSFTAVKPPEEAK